MEREARHEKLKDGHNVEVHVLFSRHAEKDSHSGSITLQGMTTEYFAKLNEKRYDENTPSSVEMSQAIASDILHIVESTKTMPSDSKKFLPNIVHF